MTSRRLLLTSLGLPFLQGCTAPFAALTTTATTPEAAALLLASAGAHGGAALASIHDISVRYAGHWRGLVGTLQPDLVDEGFRGGSEERLLLRDHVWAQAYTGPDGAKYVLRRDDRVRVWFNGMESQTRAQRDAAALVADGYALFLLGPMLLAGPWAGRTLVLTMVAPERIDVGGQTVACDVLRGRLTPGIGFSEADDLALFLGRDDRLMRRVRFSLNGLEATRGAVAEVDCWNHLALQGVSWPTRFHEHLLRPLPLPVHDWRLEGLDLNRGFGLADIGGPGFAGNAVPPATRIPQTETSSG